MTSLVISFTHESWGLVSLGSKLLVPLNNFARSYEVICHFTPLWLNCSTMTLQSILSESSGFFDYIFGCVRLHNDSSYSTMTHSAPQWLILLHNDSLEYSFKFFHIPSESSKLFYYILAYGNFAYVSRGFSIKGWPNLVQESSSIFFLNHHQWSLPYTKVL